METYELLQQTAKDKSIILKPLNIDKSISTLLIYADERHVHQILINLLSNAIKYTPPGGSVWMDAEHTEDTVKISIHDTGVGIPQHKLERLFERFERGEDKYSKTQEGTGIGLNLTKQLIELNGGKIVVESTEKQGSIFSVILPLSKKKYSEVIECDNDSMNFIQLKGLSAIIADDNKETAEVLRLILQTAGATARVASNVQDAINLIKENSPDIVLTDLVMSGESGLVLIDYIRCQSEASINKLPIIALSASAFPNDQKNVLDAGASLFIAKPFRPHEVIASIKVLVSNLAPR